MYIYIYIYTYLYTCINHYCYQQYQYCYNVFIIESYPYRSCQFTGIISYQFLPIIVLIVDLITFVSTLRSTSAVASVSPLGLKMYDYKLHRRA